MENTCHTTILLDNALIKFVNATVVIQIYGNKKWLIEVGR